MVLAERRINKLFIAAHRKETCNKRTIAIIEPRCKELRGSKVALIAKTLVVRDEFIQD